MPRRERLLVEAMEPFEWTWERVFAKKKGSADPRDQYDRVLKPDVEASSADVESSTHEYDVVSGE